MDSTLVEYVKKAFEHHLSADEVKRSLLANGWTDGDVTAAIMAASAPEAPQAPKIQTIPVPPPTIQRLQARNPELYSLYGVFLAVVLFFGLLILSNKIIGDIGRHFGTDITGKLIADTFIILPFLLVAFALHYSLTGQGEKFRILSMPYYIVSGWLLVKLLFNVSNYILSTQVVYGVYVVLILIVVVLTAVVFFVQKFIRHKV